MLALFAEHHIDQGKGPPSLSRLYQALENTPEFMGYNRSIDVSNPTLRNRLELYFRNLHKEFPSPWSGASCLLARLHAAGPANSTHCVSFDCRAHRSQEEEKRTRVQGAGAHTGGHKGVTLLSSGVLDATHNLLMQEVQALRPGYRLHIHLCAVHSHLHRGALDIYELQASLAFEETKGDRREQEMRQWKWK